MAAVPPPDAGSQAETWARKLAALRDPSVQVGWVRSELERAGALRAADALCVVLARAEQRDERHAILLLRVSLALCSVPPLKRAIAAVADARGQYALARFLGASEEMSHTDDEEPESERDVPDFGRGRPLTLGERKALARTHDRSLLARVLRDPSPDVIRILLENPAVIEADVVRLCARRPARPQVLAQVFQHQRWVLRYRVRLALALNPCTSEDIALQLLPHLAPADLREVSASSQISPRVREACFERNQKPLH
jgi:hypothetical protein